MLAFIAPYSPCGTLLAGGKGGGDAYSPIVAPPLVLLPPVILLLAALLPFIVSGCPNPGNPRPGNGGGELIVGGGASICCVA